MKKRKRRSAYLRGVINRREFIRRSASLAAGSGILYASGSLRTMGRVLGGAEETYDTVVVGGGISGLAAAYLARDRTILLLEKRDTLGGRIASGEWGGVHYPKGMEYIGKPEGLIAEWFSELGLRAVAIPPPTDAVARGGRVYWGENILGFLPSAAARRNYYGLSDFLIALNNSGIEEAVLENPGRLPRYASLDRISVSEGLERKGVDPLIRQLIDVENRGLFGAGNSDLSALFNIPEMAFDLPDEKDAIVSEVYTFPRGMIELVEALERKLAGRYVTGAEVTRVETNAGGTATVTYETASGKKTVRASSVILAAPAPLTAGIVAGGFSAPVLDALRSIPYTVYVTLTLFLSERPWRNSWSIASMDDFFVTFYDSLRTQVPADYTQKGIVGLYIAPRNASDQSLLNMSNDDILENSLRSLERYDPAVRQKVEGYDITRFRHAFPVFGTNYIERAAPLVTDSTTRGPLFLAGDYVGHPTFEGAVASAVRAYERLDNYL